MQDRFKFRCFNKFQNKIYDVKTISYIDDIVKRIEVQDEERILIFDEWMKNIDNTVLMQSTGLKDKNGKLIYEGDIVKTSKGVANVEYDNTYAYFGLTNFLTVFSFDKFINEEIEVIGNIYENPELIGGAECTQN